MSSMINTQSGGVTRESKGSTITRVPNDYGGGAKKSQQCHNYFLQCSTFASDIPLVRTWGAKPGSCSGRHL